MTDAELEDLARRFNACNVPRPEWTHAAHLAVGLWHVSRYGRRDALVRLRAGITRLNESNGVVNSPTSGYHETVTRAYVDLLADFAARHAQMTPAERVTALLADPLSHRNALPLLLTPASRGLGGAFGLGRTRPRAAALGNNPRAPGSHV